MVVIGVILIAVGVVLLVGGIFGTGIDSELGDTNRVETTLTFFGFGTDPTTLFVLGMAAMALILVGAWVVKTGTKRAWALRKERKATRKQQHGADQSAQQPEVTAARRHADAEDPPMS
jgi:hypothetical protein